MYKQNTYICIYRQVFTNLQTLQITVHDKYLQDYLFHKLQEFLQLLIGHKLPAN